MALGRNLKIAIRTLRSHALRSVLTLSGVVIGVGALITMVAVGDGAQAIITESIRSLGSNLLLIQPGMRMEQGVQLGAGAALSVSADDAIAIENELPSVISAAPYVSGNVQVIAGNRNWATRVAGVTPNYLATRDWEIDQGEPLLPEHEDQAGKVTVLGKTVADALFDKENPIGKSIRVGGLPVTVIALLKEKGQSPAGVDQDDIVFVPLSTAKLRIIGRNPVKPRAVDGIVVRVFSEQAMAETLEEVRALLRQRHGLLPNMSDDFIIQNLAEIMAIGQQATRQFTLLVAILASVSLVVGGIGVMNVLLVSVSERTREIGLRLALGARRRDLRRQFLTEAIVLSSLGGVLGIGLGIITAFAVTQVLGWNTVVRPQAILLGFGSSALIGLIFGSLPAFKAARMNPIDALRTE